ncbi:MAG: hypothetical protein JST54_28320 [Deltaproteobacteria bacterium]|nr:hypothetical protein [Deltaproteobacteria bacterium]
MAIKLAGLWVALALAGCSGDPPAATDGGTDAGDPPAIDAGYDAGPPPPPVTYSTARGTLTGADAFPVVSAQTILQVASDGGPADYVAFQVSDASQCFPATLDGGSLGPPPAVAHVLTGFVRNFDGSAVQPGSYLIGFTHGNQVQAYTQLIEFDRATGNSATLLAISGYITVRDIDGGHLDSSIDVTLGDPVTQWELPLSGDFTSDGCGP